MAAGSGLDDLACCSKSPAVLGLAGHPREARRVLDLVDSRLDVGDDFATADGVKSHNAILTGSWSYPNGWTALAAQRHLLGYQDGDTGGLRSTLSAVLTTGASGSSRSSSATWTPPVPPMANSVHYGQPDPICADAPRPVRTRPRHS
ncbi:hypothetical protein [Allokutzneria oryzae]|uniref:Uncharacterized protein n=1 Tax=Allokutzneria oryzae TaxID=1378989 RepID=A0ABV5ZYS1_9PSEU